MGYCTQKTHKPFFKNDTVKNYQKRWKQKHFRSFFQAGIPKIGWRRLNFFQRFDAQKQIQIAENYVASKKQIISAWDKTNHTFLQI